MTNAERQAKSRKQKAQETQGLLKDFEILAEVLTQEVDLLKNERLGMLAALTETRALLELSLAQLQKTPLSPQHKQVAILHINQALAAIKKQVPA
jgi:hypothetical protein